ncbi:MAG TPA: hypothetical protein VGR00_06640, partial [Thermoanaerobaculia bacterium]|nr:hypothetical protein [Thermoanaerobaculia bacterium]
MLAMPVPLAPFVRFLSRQSEGNPFFVAEYLRTAVDEKVLHRQDARWHIAGNRETEADFEALPLPRSVRDLVTRRFRDLSAAARFLAEAASVLGREPEEELLASLVDVDSSAVGASALAELLARGLLERDDAGRLRFAHDKIRETAYDALPAEKKKSLHERAGLALEAFAKSRSGLERGGVELRYAELSRHFLLAGDEEKALFYSEKAALRALEAGAYREGEDLLARVVSLDERRGEKRATPLTRARWQRLRAGASFGLGDLATCGKRAEEGLRLLGLPMPATPGEWKRALGKNLAVQAAHRFLPRALLKARPEQWETLAEASFAAQRLSERHYFAADALAMVTSSLLSVNLAERTGVFPQVSRTYAMLGLVAGSSGLARVGRVYFREGKSLAERTNDAAGLVYVLYADASVDLGTGDFVEAKRKAEEALEKERAVGDRQEIEVIQTILAHVAHYTGRPADARSIFFAMRDSARERANLQHETWGTYGASRSSIVLGRLDEAVELLERARALLTKQADHMSSVLCQALLAWAHLERREL